VFGLDPPGQPAPPWTTREWLNTGEALQLVALRGRVVVLHIPDAASVSLKAFLHAC
jgi:hypothetical protein